MNLAINKKLSRLLRGAINLLPSRRSEHQTDYQVLGEDVEGGLEAEYQRVVSGQLERWHVPLSSVRLEVQQLGTRDGKGVFEAALTLNVWDRESAVCLLLACRCSITRSEKRCKHCGWLT